MWNEKPFDDIFPNDYLEKYQNKQLTKKIFEYYVNIHEKLKKQPNDYKNFEDIKYDVRSIVFKKFQKMELDSTGRVKWKRRVVVGLLATLKADR